MLLLLLLPPSILPYFAAVLSSRPEFNPSTLRCRSTLMRRSPPFNSSLLFSPHAPKSTLRHFAAVLPSRAELQLSTLRSCPPLPPQIQPCSCPHLTSPPALSSTHHPSPLETHPTPVFE